MEEQEEEEEESDSDPEHSSDSDSELDSWTMAGSSRGGLSRWCGTSSGGPGPGSVSQDRERASDEREQSVV